MAQAPRVRSGIPSSLPRAKRNGRTGCGQSQANLCHPRAMGIENRSGVRYRPFEARSQRILRARGYAIRESDFYLFGGFRPADIKDPAVTRSGSIVSGKTRRPTLTCCIRLIRLRLWPVGGRLRLAVQILRGPSWIPPSNPIIH